MNADRTALPKCSVVIPAFRCEAYIAACLRSVQCQSMKEIEILVIDDCSPDGMAKIVREMAEADKRIRYIRQETNQGVAAARNRGVREANSEWIAFLDSDDMWTPDKLSRQFDRVKQTGAALVYTGARCVDESGRLTDKRFFVPLQLNYKRLRKGNDIVCSSALVKRELLLRRPMERSDLHEDYICWLRLLEEGCKAAGVQEELVLYRLTKDSKSRVKFRSAVTTWRSLAYVGVPFLQRCASMAAYTVHGLQRYM